MKRNMGQSGVQTIEYKNKLYISNEKIREITEKTGENGDY